MGSGEFQEWVAYSHLEPFGERRADARAWMMVAHMSNMMRKEETEPVDLQRILPDWTPPKEVPSVAMVSQQIDLFFETRVASQAARKAHG